MTVDIRTSDTHPLEVNGIKDARADWLALTPAPGRWGPSTKGWEWQRDLDADLERLTELHSADVLVCLIEDHEFRVLRIPDLVKRAEARGLEVIQCPIVDGGVPSTLGKVEPLVEQILARGAAGRRVVIHCQAGLGRTGTIAGCCLAALGFEIEAIFTRLREDRSKRCPENETQREFIRRYAARRSTLGN